jgi:hypothetical protein
MCSCHSLCVGPLTCNCWHALCICIAHSSLHGNYFTTYSKPCRHTTGHGPLRRCSRISRRLEHRGGNGKPRTNIKHQSQSWCDVCPGVPWVRIVGHTVAVIHVQDDECSVLLERHAWHGPLRDGDLTRLAVTYIDSVNISGVVMNAVQWAYALSSYLLSSIKCSMRRSFASDGKWTQSRVQRNPLDPPDSIQRQHTNT